MKNHPIARNIFDDEARNATEQEDLANRLLDESNIQKTKAEMVLDQELLKKYIIYAKRHVSPKLNEIDKDKVTDFYAAIRQASSAVGGIPIAVRHIESVIRMSEAYAKLHLRDYVRSDDIDFAIDMMLESFLQSQKLTVSRVLSKKLDKYKSKVTDVNSLLLHILKKLADEQALLKKVKSGIEETEKVAVEIKINHFKGEARDFNAVNVDQFLKSSYFKRDFKIHNDTISTVREI
jgi:DNA replication licensing factor MCM2